MHIGWSFSPWLWPLAFLSRSSTNLLHLPHFSLLFGTTSISWCGHQIHISLPANRLLISGIDPVVIPWLQDLFADVYNVILPSMGPHWTILAHPFRHSSTGGVTLGILTAHHFYLAHICDLIVADSV